jgi:hypothetical protein
MFSSFSFDFKQLKNSLFLRLTRREQNCTPKVGWFTQNQTSTCSHSWLY